MEIRCKFCQEFFNPGDENLELIAAGYFNSDSVNTCDDCWNIIQLEEFDYSEFFMEPESGL